MTAWKCDRCGKDLGYENLTGLYLDGLRTRVLRFYLCSECASGVMHYLAEPSRERVLEELKQASEKEVI